jgi:hypothetical protein
LRASARHSPAVSALRLQSRLQDESLVRSPGNRKARGSL